MRSMQMKSGSEKEVSGTMATDPVIVLDARHPADLICRGDGVVLWCKKDELRLYVAFFQ